MFQGFVNVCKGEYFQFVMNCGGLLNGIISYDCMNYYEMLLSNEFVLGFWFEVDWMCLFVVNEENFENQCQVVMEEYCQSYGDQFYVEIDGGMFFFEECLWMKVVEIIDCLIVELKIGVYWYVFEKCVLF